MRKSPWWRPPRCWWPRRPSPRRRTPPAPRTTLRSAANNQYVCAQNQGAAPPIANRTAIGQWEEFDLLT
jgi:hypothetical protein